MNLAVKVIIETAAAMAAGGFLVGFGWLYADWVGGQVCPSQQPARYEMTNPETRRHAGGMHSCALKGGRGVHEIKPWGELVFGCRPPGEEDDPN